MMAMRDLGAIAGGMVEGMRTASDLNAANQQYDLRQRQLAELDRKESMRARLAAIDPNTYRRKTAAGTGYYDRGALMSEQAKAYGEFGETEKAGALLGDLDEWKTKELGRHAMQIYAAHQAGDVPSLLKSVSEMTERFPNGNFARPEDLKFDPKTGDVIGIARDMATGQPISNKPFRINVNKLYETSFATLDPEGYGKQKMQEASRARDRAAIVGARQSEPALVGSDSKGNLPIYRAGMQHYTPGSKGRLVPYEGDMAQIRWLDKPGGTQAALPEGPNMRALREAMKNLENTDNPDTLRASLVEAERTARTQDLILGLRYVPHDLQSIRDAVSEAYKSGVPLTAAHLVAAGIPDELAQMGYQAGVLHAQRRPALARE